MNTRRVILWCVVLAAVVVVAWFGYTHRVAIRERLFSNTNTETLPPAVNKNEAVLQNVNAIASNTNSSIPRSYNLRVSFTSQAPDANWDQDHEEFCEEAAVLMVGRYWQGHTIVDTADAEQALQQLKTWELAHLGFYYDTTAAETASMLAGMYGLRFDILEHPTVATIEREVAAGNPVIVPTDGRMLHNPNFKQPGPVYHNLVIKGYTDDGKFITNDPGTRKGADYVYDTSVVMDAMHDWVPGTDRTKPANGSATGEKVVIIAHGT